ncbi:spermatogenesis-associated serine-rich protein 2 [Arapaima gigas]
MLVDTHKPKKKKPKPPAEPQPAPADTPADTPAPPAGSRDAVNGFHANGSVVDGDSLDSLSEQLESASLDATELDSEAATPDLSDATGGEGDLKSSTPSLVSQQTHGGRSHPGSRASKTRSRPAATSASSLLLPDDGQLGVSVNKKIASNIEKSVKDLQRCTASLTRYRVVVKDEMDSSIKRMKQTFAELQSCLMDREVALLAEMDKVKAEAMAILDGRQKRAEELRRLTDRSGSMSEDQLTELRADIKHFVSERKYDEDLGRALKFTYEMEPLKKSIMSFGHVYHPQTGYSSRSRCSSAASSVASPAPQEAAAPVQPQGSGSRPGQTQKQGFQSNRRPGQGHPSGGQRLNGGSYQDRNPNRINRRYQGGHGEGPASSTPSTSPPPSSVSTNGPTQSLTAPSQLDHPEPNSLPQRPPRTRCP